MCEPVLGKTDGWKGWRDLPAPRVSAALGAWVDLSHRLTEDLARIPSFPQPRIRQIHTMPDHHANVTELHMVVHHGTHLDAPRHFIADGPAMDEIPLERLYGPGVVWGLDVADEGIIDVSHLERATPRMQDGDIVLLATGRARHIGAPSRYEQHASLSGDAAEWLADHGAKIVGVDFSTPDLAAHLRPAGFAWPVHHILLSRGVLIGEHLNLGADLAGRRCDIMFLALKIGGSDGAPARVIARRAD